MAFINRTPAGTYRAFWCDPAGLQRSKNFRTRREAKTFLTEIESRMVNGSYADPNGGRTLRDARSGLDDDVEPRIHHHGP